jgi:hypothetical protein
MDGSDACVCVCDQLQLLSRFISFATLRVSPSALKRSMRCQTAHTAASLWYGVVCVRVACGVAVAAHLRFDGMGCVVGWCAQTVLSIVWLSDGAISEGNPPLCAEPQ